VQGGKVVQNSVVSVAGVDPVNSITDSFCNQQNMAFGDTNSFEKLGGMATMGGAIGRGMVLALSVWGDHAVNMLWLDSPYPTDKDATTPGVARGTCATTSGVPATIESANADASVIYQTSGEARPTAPAAPRQPAALAPLDPLAAPATLAPFPSTVSAAAPVTPAQPPAPAAPPARS